MSNKFKETGLKNRTYYFFDDMLNCFCGMVDRYTFIHDHCHRLSSSQTSDTPQEQNLHRTYIKA